MPVEITAPGRHLRCDDTVFRRRRLAPDEVVELDDGMRATTPLRTAFDLATRPHVDDAVVAADALGRLGGFTGTEIGELSARHRGTRGVRRVAPVADLVDPGAASPPETRTRLLLVRAGLPRPTTHFGIVNEFGWVFAWVDLAWPAHRVAVEYDGRDHAQQDRRGRDLDRLEEIRAEGWTVLVLTARQLRARERTIDLVRRALVARGWTPPA